jgi:hypothetical protein
MPNKKPITQSNSMINNSKSFAMQQSVVQQKTTVVDPLVKMQQ